MGRPTKSLNQHKLHGTPARTADKPSAFVGGRPKYPTHLSPIARSEFKRCVKLLEERGTLTPGDAATLAVYAEVYARWIQAKREIGDELMITTQVTDNNGTLRTVTRLHPLLKVAEVCEARLLSLAKSMGLTPVDREHSKPTQVNAGEEIIPGSLADLRQRGEFLPLLVPTPTVAPPEEFEPEEKL